MIVNQFSRSRVERGDFWAFLAKFGEDQVPRGAALAGLMGGIVFAVDGYDNDPRETYAIPEIRRFYGAFHKAWPYPDLRRTSPLPTGATSTPLGATPRLGHLSPKVNLEPSTLEGQRPNPWRP